ncbi:MAG TPA: LacI family DNA-binding transcriptional regulator [Thermotogota bacterium]|nr:LacI family DNA-binding transcriptional regulator [Thermotogota bacterium]HRW93105.1 LacI family DNA-binding transcriptional regulator [Thermotogota bacterium]
MANMKDVARLAGVSVATVSNVISGRKYVSPALKERVETVMKEMRYRPSKIARSLKIQRSFLVGLLVPDITNPYFAEIARGVESVALKNDYQMFLCNSDGNHAREEITLESFHGHGVDGVINVAPRMEEGLLAHFSEGMPMVIVDRHLSIVNPLIDVIYTNNFKGSAELAAHFLSTGHNRFACIAGPQDVPTAVRRLQGFCNQLTIAGIPASRNHIFSAEFKYEDGFRVMKEILKLKPRPTAVFAGNDMMAWGAMEAVLEEKVRVPEEISIAGFDNVFFSNLVVPSLTTVHQPKFESGQLAMELLLEKIQGKIEGKPCKTRRRELDSQLIVRDSTRSIQTMKEGTA